MAEPKPWIIYERSTDYGATWQECEVSDRSPLYAELRSKRSDEIYDDGTGNLYRWRARTSDPTTSRRPPVPEPDNIFDTDCCDQLIEITRDGVVLCRRPATYHARATGPYGKGRMVHRCARHTPRRRRGS